MNPTDPMFSLILLGLLSVLALLFYLAQRLTRTSLGHIPLPQTVKGHHWVFVQAFPPGKYCNVCDTSSFHGAQCDHCGLISDDQCLRAADKTIPCKQMTSVASSMRHHWVSGNLPSTAQCEVCENPCSYGPGLQDYRCVWCQHCVHEDCRASFSSICDFGKLKKMVIPPTCVKLRMVGWKGNRHFVVKEVGKPSLRDWSPVLVICNQRSGNGDGDLVLQAFRRVLNPAQVLDLSKAPPERGLEWCRLMKDADVRCRILVAGGDGTVGWVLDTIEELNIEPQPEVFLLPLGTGNDLSRVLGWGQGHSGEVDPMAVLHLLETAQPVFLDRWAVSVLDDQSRIKLTRRKEKKVTMSGYLSIGVDAMVTLNFHNKRYQLPSWLIGRAANKLLFFHYGTRDLVERMCFELNLKLELYLDGQKVDLPSLESVVVLNIASWGAGVRPWELCKCGDVHPTQAFDDGLLEVIGISSSFHIAQMQVGLSEPIRLGQASEVIIRFLDPGGGDMPMQVDGEPWLQKSAQIRIGHKCRARLLGNPHPGQYSVLKRSLSALFSAGILEL